MAIVSKNSARNLFWLGRYVMRTEAMTEECVRSFDYILDVDKEDGKRLFAKLGVTVSYKNASEFLAAAIFSDNASSVFNSISMARENAICCRDLLEDSAFKNINESYYELVAAKEKQPSVYLLESILYKMTNFTGSLNSHLIESIGSQIVEFGMMVERCDLSVRLLDNLNALLFEVAKLNAIGNNICKNYKPVKVSTDDRAKLIEAFSGLEGQLIR